MKIDYKNWVPKGMVMGVAAGAAVSAGALTASAFLTKGTTKKVLMGITGAATVGFTVGTVALKMMYDAFDYNGKLQLSKKIIESIADYVELPEGAKILDIGCGSGALTIACAKKNPEAKITGIDRWGKEYSSFSKTLCENNAVAEGVANVEFVKGDATKLGFEDETFDAVVSNYVYHNIVGADKQECLRETLRVLKKGGTFALHDIMTPSRYGDMNAFVEELKTQGYEKIEMIDITGKIIDKKTSMILGLEGSALLYGIK